jgi:uncharacterized protein (DUF2164 family)
MREELERSFELIGERLNDIEEGLEAVERKMMEAEEDYERRWRDMEMEIWRLQRKVKRLEKRNLRREGNMTLSLVSVLLGGVMVFASLPQPPIIKTCWWGLVLGGCIFIGGLWGFLREVGRKWK